MRKRQKRIILVLVAMAFIVLFKMFVMDKVIVQGTSMLDTCQDGDVLWVEKITYHIEIKRKDVVVIRTDKGSMIKRVIGLPGETVLILNGMVYVDSNKVIEDDMALIKDGGIASSGITLKENQYFVLGDNRNNSYDSREEQVGAIELSQIIGKPFFRFFPINRIGKVE